MFLYNFNLIYFYIFFFYVNNFSATTYIYFSLLLRQHFSFSLSNNIQDDIWYQLTEMGDCSSGPVHYKGVQVPFICFGILEKMKQKQTQNHFILKNGLKNLMWVQMRYSWNAFTAYKPGLGTAQRCDLILNRTIFSWTNTVLLHSHQRWEKSNYYRNSLLLSYDCFHLWLTLTKCYRGTIS